MRNRMPARLYLVAVMGFLGALGGCAISSNNTRPSISLEKTACYGRCPVYRFTLYSDGRYVWEGRADVSVMGTVRGSMSTSAYTTAMQLLNDFRYQEFKDSYQADADCETWATDNPTVSITVADTLHPKTIVHYRGCEGFAGQEALTKLEDDLDEVFRTRRFKG